MCEHVSIRGKGKGCFPVVCPLMAILWREFIHYLLSAGEKRHSWASASVSRCIEGAREDSIRESGRRNP
jgi:hypothetical protein